MATAAEAQCRFGSLEAGIRAALASIISDRTYLSILERYDVAHVAVSSAP